VSTQYEEFPELTPEALAAFEAGCAAAVFPVGPTNLDDRRYLAAFLREAMKQAVDTSLLSSLEHLEAIANNLHSPPATPANPGPGSGRRSGHASG
jgi:hypothetical protein